MIIEDMFFTQDVTKLSEDSKKHLGLLITANKPIEGLPLFIQEGSWWILDNGAFTKQGFIQEYWEQWLDFMREQDSEIFDKCLCVVIPDVVADAKKTLRQFMEYNPLVKLQGFRTALVTQNGMTKNMLPWDYFDVLFIGGDDDHKMGLEAAYLIEEGLKRDKHIHVGRVNTEYRLMQFWHCHTWDGTALTIKPEKYESIIINGVKAVIEKKKQMDIQPTLFNL
jgi:hypothetical protein